MKSAKYKIFLTILVSIFGYLMFYQSYINEEKSIVNEYEERFSIGHSYEQIKPNLIKNSIDFRVESKVDTISLRNLEDNFEFQIVYAVDAPGNVLRLWGKKFVVIIRFDEQEIVNQLLINTRYLWF